MVSVCLPSDALLQHLLSYLGFSYLGCGVSLHGCSSKAQPLLLTLEEGYLLTISAGGCDNRRSKRRRLPWAHHSAGKRSHPTSEVRGGGREDQPHVHGALAVQAQEGLEEISHVEGQEGQQ